MKLELMKSRPVQSIKSFTAQGAVPGQSRRGRIDRWALDKLFAATGRAPIRLRLWNGLETGQSDPAPIATVRIHDRVTLLKLLVYPELYFGEAYCSGALEVEGSLVRLLEHLYVALANAPTQSFWHQLLTRGIYRARDTTIEASRENIHCHYNIGNDFYRLWLDEQMVYTCAYFRSPTDTLEQAQINKMDHVCRKLELRPGQTVVEAGCGWGSLALHMAQHYGVTVTAYNIAHEQICYARQRAQELGLQNRVEFVEVDYRNISGQFDVFVSVGMLEHVGFKHLDAFGEVIQRSLKDSGRGLIHFIGHNRPAVMNAWIERYIFPGGYSPTLSEAAKILESGNFTVLDVENIRLHYAKTLEHWLARFERAAPQVTRMFGEAFVRTWRLYLSGSLAAFNTGDMQLFQVVFNRYGNNRVPWTREYLYQHPPRGASNDQILGIEAASSRGE